MLNTKIVFRAATLVGSCAVAAAQTPCAVTSSQVLSVPTITDLGGPVTKLRAGQVLTRGVNELLALQGSTLVMVRDALSAPKQLVLAEDVVDFAVLPPLDGLSRVLVVGAAGLRVSKTSDAGAEIGQTLDLRQVVSTEWAEVTALDVAESGGGVHLIGAAGSQLRRAKLVDGSLVAQSTLALASEILQVAIADASSVEGLEAAVRCADGLHFYKQGGSVPYLSIPTPTAGEFLAVDRIPRGAGTLDSFGVWGRIPGTDFFQELVGTQLSAAIVGGPGLLHGDVSYGALGIQFAPQLSTLETDMVVATQDNQIVALHGVPQTTPGLPFVLEPGEFSIHSLHDWLGDIDIAGVRVACGDFDGDGDGDLALVNNAAEGGAFAFVRNDCSYADSQALVSPYAAPDLTPDSSSTPGEMGVLKSLEVRQPPIFNGAQPTHVRVRVFVREYYQDLPLGMQTQAEICPEVWWESRPADLLVAHSPLLGSSAPYHTVLDIVNTTQLPPSTLGSPPPQLTTSNVIAYFEFVPLIKASDGTVVQRANATVWVGAVSPSMGLVAELICEDEPDEFTPLFPCATFTGEDTGQLITEMHRRKVIRPIAPWVVPQ